MQVLAPLPIGFAVFMVHLATIPITGTGINPARSFGAAVIYNNDKAWDDHVNLSLSTLPLKLLHFLIWVFVICAFWLIFCLWCMQWIFWVGPFVGALAAAAYHQYILRAAAIKALGSFRSNPTNWSPFTCLQVCVGMKIGKREEEFSFLFSFFFFVFLNFFIASCWVF